MVYGPEPEDISDDSKSLPVQRLNLLPLTLSEVEAVVPVEYVRNQREFSELSR